MGLNQPFRDNLTEYLRRYQGLFVRLGETTSQYITILRWLALDSLWRYRAMVFGVVATGFLGITFQISAIGQAIFYAKILKDGRIITLLGHQLAPRTSMMLLALFAFGMLLALLLSAGLIYYSQSRLIKLASRFEEFCSERILHTLIGSPPDLDPLTGEPYDRAEIMFLSMSGSRQCGIAFRLLVDIITPGVTFIASICFLLYASVFLTGILCTILFVSLPILVKVNVHGARSSVSFEKYGRASNREKQQLIHKIIGVTVPLDIQASWFKKMFEKEIVRDYMDAYEGRILAPMRSHLVSHAVQAFSIFALLLVFGGSAISQGANWGRLIIYLVALRYCLNNLLQVSGGATNINRFYPVLRRYFYFIRGAEASKNLNESSDHIVTLIPSPSNINDSPVQCELRKGHILAIVSPDPLNRLTLRSILGRLLHPNTQELEPVMQSLWFITHKYTIPPVPLGVFLGLRPDNRRENFQTLIKDSGLLERLNAQIPRNLDIPLSMEAWDEIDVDLRYALGLFAALRSNARWIVLDAKGLVNLSDQARTYFFKSLQKHITLIVYERNLQNIGKYDEQLVAVLDDKGLVGVGKPEWIWTRKTQIENILRKARGLEKVITKDDTRDNDFDLEI